MYIWHKLEEHTAIRDVARQQDDVGQVPAQDSGALHHHRSQPPSEDYTKDSSQACCCMLIISKGADEGLPFRTAQIRGLVLSSMR